MSERVEKEELVSVIMPAYNCADFIGESIDSVIEQTYKNWELVIVDDCSTDNTKEIIDRYMQRDSRIKYYKLEQNSGAAIARNKAIEMAQGVYLAFLDSDDLWIADKLRRQILFMKKHNYIISCTAYGKIDEKSNVLDKVVLCKKYYLYDDVLVSCPGNSTIIYNVNALGKTYGENLRRRNDFALLLKNVKKIEGKYKIYGLQEVCGYHRLRTDAISIKKTKLISYQWYVYRKIANQSRIKSIKLVLIKIVQTLIKQNG